MRYEYFTHRANQPACQPNSDKASTSQSASFKYLECLKFYRVGSRRFCKIKSDLVFSVYHHRTSIPFILLIGCKRKGITFHPSHFSFLSETFLLRWTASMNANYYDAKKKMELLQTVFACCAKYFWYMYDIYLYCWRKKRVYILLWQILEQFLTYFLSCYCFTLNSNYAACDKTVWISLSKDISFNFWTFYKNIVKHTWSNNREMCMHIYPPLPPPRKVNPGKYSVGFLYQFT